MSDEQKGVWRVQNPIAWGICATVVLAIIVGLIGIQTGPDGIARFKEFASLPSNAVGDTLAGIFAPLAFIWIVVTVFLQSHELREQRVELGLTREELRLAREAQEKQLSVMQKQADIFENEQKQRDQAQAKEELDETLLTLRLHLKVGGRRATWDVESMADNPSLHRSDQLKTENETEFFAFWSARAANCLEELAYHEARSVNIDYPQWPIEFDRALSAINYITKSLNLKLAPAMQERVLRLRLQDLADTLSDLRADTRLWDGKVSS